MRLRLETIEDNGVNLQLNEPVESFPALQQLRDEQIAFTTPVTGEVRLVRTGDTVTVNGQLRTRVKEPCSRCLRLFEHDLVSALDVTLATDKTENETAEPELELAAEDVETLPLEGEEIDLRQLVEEQLVLDLNCKPLCSKDCLGLCPVCGCDKNEVRCDCDPEPFPGPFDALKKLKLDS